MLRPAPIIPFRLTSSSVGASPTRLLTDAGHRMDTTVSSPIAQVTRFAATDVAEPALESLPRVRKRWPKARGDVDGRTGYRVEIIVCH